MDFIYSIIILLTIVVFLIVIALIFSWVVFDLLNRRQSASYKAGNWGILALIDNEPYGDGSPAEPPGVQSAAIPKQTTALRKQRAATLKRKRPTCRDEVIAAARIVTREKGVDEFTAKEIVDFLVGEDTEYSANTIRNYVASRCCVNAAGNHNGYGDFMRVVRGRYRLAIG